MHFDEIVVYSTPGWPRYVFPWIFFGFSRTVEAYQKKFEIFFKSYKENKLVNSISGNDKHECKFYDSLDQW